MTRLEFNAIMKKMAKEHSMEECPEDLANEYWEKSKHLSTDQFAKSLKDYFKTFTDKYNMPETGEEFAQEANEFKRELASLLKRMLTRGAGQIVLQEMADHFGVEVDFQIASNDEVKEMFEDVENSHIKGNEATGTTNENKDLFEQSIKKYEDKFKCPDAITPEILKILKGDKK